MTSLTRTLTLALLLAVPTAVLAQQAYTTKVVNLRAGPDRGYPLVVVVTANTAVDVHGCVDRYSWCDVTAGPYQGWIYAGNLSSPYENRRVPLLGYGAAIGLPIVVFSINSYWNDHYRQRPFYRDRDRWQNRPPHFRPPSRPYPGRPGSRPPGRPDFHPGRPDHRPPGRPEARPPTTRPPVTRPPGGSGRPGEGRPGGGDGGRPGHAGGDRWTFTPGPATC
jgi:uncharacterized protein YraI